MKEIIISLIALLIFMPFTHAGKEKKSNRPGKISSLIKQLNDDEFSKREEAVKQLTKLGATAVPALTRATRLKSPEPSMRAFDIIVRQYRNGNDETKEKATNALKKIAKSKSSHATKAKEVIEAPKEVAGNSNTVTAKADIRVEGEGISFKRVSVTVQNGITKVDAEENGQKVKILDDPENGISVEITEDKEGKKETHKYQAADTEELKKKHPEAHKLYRKYTGNVKADEGTVNIRIESKAP